MTITEQFEQVARELAPLNDSLVLADSGLDSLGFAVLIARLEDILGISPFMEAGSLPVTFGDLVKAYESASVEAMWQRQAS